MLHLSLQYAHYEYSCGVGQLGSRPLEVVTGIYQKVLCGRLRMGIFERCKEVACALIGALASATRALECSLSKDCGWKGSNAR